MKKSAKRVSITNEAWEKEWKDVAPMRTQKKKRKKKNLRQLTATPRTRNHMKKQANRERESFKNWRDSSISEIEFVGWELKTQPRTGDTLVLFDRIAVTAVRVMMTMPTRMIANDREWSTGLVSPEKHTRFVWRAQWRLQSRRNGRALDTDVAPSGPSYVVLR